MATSATMVGEIEIFRDAVRTVQNVVHRNVEGISQEESLMQPQPAGNCVNWVVGHLVSVYDEVLPLVQQNPVLGRDALKRYGRGTPPLENPSEALPLTDLLAAWDKASDRMEAGLANLSAERLDAPAPVSPRNNPKETVRSFLGLIFFHQAYHTGQLGLLRRIAGKQGAIA